MESLQHGAKVQVIVLRNIKFTFMNSEVTAMWSKWTLVKHTCWKFLHIWYRNVTFVFLSASKSTHMCDVYPK